MKELESILSLADVIDTSGLSGTVKFGARSRLSIATPMKRSTYRIVGEPEADLERGLLNMRSPLGARVIGKDVGDTVEVRTPGGERSYEILEIQFRITPRHAARVGQMNQQRQLLAAQGLAWVVAALSCC